MSIEIRTFVISDAHPDEGQALLSGFLRTVEMKRIDTAYAEGAWRVLVHFVDMRHKEETRQIESAIVGALNSWRERAAVRDGIAPDAILSDGAVREVARFAPTTEHELSVIGAAADIDHGTYRSEIVQVVRSTLEDLID